MCNICDDKLINKISLELAHQGLVLPISEIEAKAIRIYDKMQSNQLYSKFTTKTEEYYTLMTSLVCAEAIAAFRLTEAKNIYEVTSILALLQGYCDTFSEILQKPYIKASEAFMDILKRLQFKIDIEFKDKLLGALAHTILASPGQTPVATKKCRLCTNADNPGRMLECSECVNATGDDLIGDCAEHITFGLSYKTLCVGLKLDPNILAINGYMSNDKLKEYSKVVENIIDKAATEMKNYSSDIVIKLYEEINNGN